MKPTVPRVLALTFVVLLGCYAFIWAPQLGAGDAPEATWRFDPPAQPVAVQEPSFPPAGQTFIGVQTRAGVEDFTDQQRFAIATNTPPRVYEFSQGWAVHKFDRRSFDKVAARNMLPLLSWEPWNFRAESTRDRERSEQPDFSLSKIIAGDYDDYIRSWAQGIAALRYPVGIRLAHEMNGYWYPWCEQSNGNQPGQYVQMWRHVHDIFTAANATNVVWVWSPNATYDTATPLPGLFPGDDYVDWIGVSGYYGTAGQKTYLPFASIFGPTLTELAQLSKRPVVVTEVGATDAQGRRTEWITDMFRSLPQFRQIIGVIWYESEREIDWRIGGAPDAARAFGAGASEARYDAPWSPYTRPLTTAPG